jgi:hypothetical protein
MAESITYMGHVITCTCQTYWALGKPFKTLSKAKEFIKATEEAL